MHIIRDVAKLLKQLAISLICIHDDKNTNKILLYLCDIGAPNLMGHFYFM